MDAQVIEARLRDYLKRAITDNVNMPEEVIQAAGEEFKEHLRKSFNSDRNRPFKLYMSNIGKPACQLVMERNGAPKEQWSYAMMLKMIYGDTIETILRAVLRASGLDPKNVNEKVTLDLDVAKINGRKDLDLDGATYDVKSSSAWTYRNKWQAGFDHIEQHDSFGYCGQLYGYSEASGTRAGGWIVACKETGEVSVVAAKDTPELRAKHLNRNKDNLLKVIDVDRPFTREFSDEAETFYKKETGNRKLGYTCSMCEYKFSCWPNLTAHTAVKSKANNKKMEYYTVFNPETVEQYAPTVSQS